MNKEILSHFVAGIFYSKLSYCLPVFGHVFGLDNYKEENSRYTSFTVTDNNRIRVIQNKLNRLLTGAPYHTPTKELLQMTDSLSIQQMIAFQTLVMTHKILKSKKPTYLASHMTMNLNSKELRNGQMLNHPKTSLAISREGFIQRGITLMNKLDKSARQECNTKKFKETVKKWVKDNINEKPKLRYATFNNRIAPAQNNQSIDRTLQGHSRENDVNRITRYFQPINKK